MLQTQQISELKALVLMVVMVVILYGRRCINNSSVSGNDDVCNFTDMDELSGSLPGQHNTEYASVHESKVKYFTIPYQK